MPLTGLKTVFKASYKSQLRCSCLLNMSKNPALGLGVVHAYNDFLTFPSLPDYQLYMGKVYMYLVYCSISRTWSIVGYVLQSLVG